MINIFIKTLILWFKYVALLCLFLMYGADILLSGLFFNHNFLLLLISWFILIFFLYVIREFLLNGDMSMDARELSSYPNYERVIAKYDKEGNAKLPRRLYFEK